MDSRNKRRSSGWSLAGTLRNRRQYLRLLFQWHPATSSEFAADSPSLIGLERIRKPEQRDDIGPQAAVIEANEDIPCE